MIGGEGPEEGAVYVSFGVASTEPPTVIGGEAKLTGTFRKGSTRFNGAADGDRRRDGQLVHVVRVPENASTEPPTVIGGEDPPGCFGKLWDPASTEPPTVIGGEARVRVERLSDEDASTEPPTVIGGERRRGGRPGYPRGASTEPPTVIGGESRIWSICLGVRIRFNGAADGDRRRGSLFASAGAPTI